MKLISCQNGRILTSLKSDAEIHAPGKILATGFRELDDLLPNGGFERGAIHELLSSPQHGSARTFALFLSQVFSGSPPHPNPLPGGEGTRGAIVWCDPQQDLYPPAIASSGIPLDRL